MLDESVNVWNDKNTQKCRKDCDEKEQGIGNYILNHGHQFHLLNHHIHLMDVVLLMPGGPAYVCEQKYHLLH